MNLTSKTRLLYAEDDPDTRDMVSFALGSEGFEVVCPTDLRHFLDMAHDEPWDLFVLDNWMPEISGVELCRQIRAFDKNTPIVFYSAVAYEHDKKEALAAGAVAYIIKPVALDDLIQRLRAALAAGKVA